MFGIKPSGVGWRKTRPGIRRPESSEITPRSKALEAPTSVRLAVRAAGSCGLGAADLNARCICPYAVQLSHGPSGQPLVACQDPMLLIG